MLSREGFDQWAPNYEYTVSDNEKSGSYPFAGYRDVVAFIEKEIAESGHAGASVLDLGFGTAFLASRLYQLGFQICGVDFSAEMLAIAKGKMPEADLYQADFTLGLPEALKNRSFDFIIGTYSLHHVRPGLRERLFSGLAEHLSENGEILVGDLIFPTSAEYEECHQKFRDVWDEEETYFTAEELEDRMKKLDLTCSFHPISFCAGVLAIRRN